jgi:ribosome-binding protein aMBF1 (putative translation factor)
MSGRMKKHLTNTKEKVKSGSKEKIVNRIKDKPKKNIGSVLCVTEKGVIAKIPSTEINKYIQKEPAQKDLKKIMNTLHKMQELAHEESDNDIFTLFSDINEKYGEKGALLRGLRLREALSQAEFAKKINITQPELSKMESGTRAIGKMIAKRLEKIFGVSYQIFL